MYPSKIVEWTETASNFKRRLSNGAASPAGKLRALHQRYPGGSGRPCEGPRPLPGQTQAAQHRGWSLRTNSVWFFDRIEIYDFSLGMMISQDKAISEMRKFFQGVNTANSNIIHQLKTEVNARRGRLDRLERDVFFALEENAKILIPLNLMDREVTKYEEMIEGAEKVRAEHQRLWVKVKKLEDHVLRLKWRRELAVDRVDKVWHATAKRRPNVKNSFITILPIWEISNERKKHFSEDGSVPMCIPPMYFQKSNYAGNNNNFLIDLYETRPWLMNLENSFIAIIPLDSILRNAGGSKSAFFFYRIVCRLIVWLVDFTRCDSQHNAILAKVCQNPIKNFFLRFFHQFSAMANLFSMFFMTILSFQYTEERAKTIFDGIWT